MPYFYKLSDSMDKNGTYINEWFKKVIFTIADFTTTCTTLTEDGTIILIVNEPNGIKSHHKKINDVDTELKYEYVTYEDVPTDKIINIDNDNLFLFTTNMVREDFQENISFEYNNLNDEAILALLDIIHDNYYDFNNLYIHITCKNYKESIEEHGLLVNPGKKIGDYDSQESNNDISLQSSQKLENYLQEPESSISFSQFLTQRTDENPIVLEFITQNLSQMPYFSQFLTQDSSQVGTKFNNIQTVNNHDDDYYVPELENDDENLYYPDYYSLMNNKKRKVENNEYDNNEDNPNKYLNTNIGGKKNKTHKRKNKTHKRKNKTYRRKNKTYRNKNKTYRNKNKTYRRKNKTYKE